MKQARGITLAEAREDIKQPRRSGGQVFRAADLIDRQALKEMRGKAEAAHRKKRENARFDEVDALGAEILARFGWNTYWAWNYAEIPHEAVMRWLYAERAREKANVVDLETIIASTVSACIRRNKKEPAPKGPKIAQKIINRHVQIANGEK